MVEVKQAGLPLGVIFGTLAPADRTHVPLGQWVQALRGLNRQAFFPMTEEECAEVGGAGAGRAFVPPAGAGVRGPAVRALRGLPRLVLRHQAPELAGREAPQPRQQQRPAARLPGRQPPGERVRGRRRPVRPLPQERRRPLAHHELGQPGPQRGGGRPAAPGGGGRGSHAARRPLLHRKPLFLEIKRNA
ncbi:unnamed protein product [Heterosigma akashiwo]